MTTQPNPTVEIIPQTETWANALTTVASQPLEKCPDFPRIAARHEAWWNCELQGAPLFLAWGSRDDYPITRGLDYLAEPDVWLKNRIEMLEHMIFIGDAVPWMRVDFGPVMLGGLLGANVEFFNDTTWTKSFINNDWSNAPDWRIHEDNSWWQILPQLIERAARHSQGKHLVCAPNLGAPGDVLLNTRGATQLCMDVIDQPERIKDAVDAIHFAWRKAYKKMWSTCLHYSAGFIEWVAVWSNKPYVVTDCDFNYMIGPKAFRDLFLPEIASRAATAGRSIFHLDGPAATVHIDALLDTPQLTAIQYQPGSGNSALAKIDMLKKVQKMGFALQVCTPANEVLSICEQLDPQSLCLLVQDAESNQQLLSLYEEVMIRF